MTTKKIRLRAGFTITHTDVIDITQQSRIDLSEPDAKTPRYRFDLGYCAGAVLKMYRTNKHQIVFRALDAGKGEWRIWSGKHWAPYTTIDLRADLTKILGPDTTATKIDQLVRTMELRCSRNWGVFNQRPVVAFDNYALAIEERNIVHKSFDPRDYNTHLLPVGIKDIPISNWESIITRILPDERDRMILQEMFGYCFFPNYSAQVFFVLQGRPHTGKSTILSVLRDMLGEERCSSTPLDSLAKDFGLQGLINSWVNFDTESEYLRPESELLVKAITGGDPMEINIKYMPPISQVILTRLIMTANTLPRFSDKTSALWERLVYIPFQIQVPLDQARTIKEILHTLKPEYPGIMWWAIQGLNRVLKSRAGRGKAFTQSPLSAAAIEEHRIDSDPFLSWFHSRFLFAENGRVNIEEAWADYSRWAEHARIKSVSKLTWHRRIANEISNQYGPHFVAKSRPRTGDTRWYALNGIINRPKEQEESHIEDGIAGH